MRNNKEEILKRYQQVSDEVFLAIKPDELTDEGKAAYYEEKIRRKSLPGYIEKKVDERVYKEAANKMKPYVKAGRLFRLFGWISAVAGIGIIAAILIPHSQDHNAPTVFSALIPSIFLVIALTILQFKVGTAIKEHKEWGRIVGILLAIIQLLSFPIGTLIGAYILWCLTKGWGDNVAIDSQNEKLDTLLAKIDK